METMDSKSTENPTAAITKNSSAQSTARLGESKALKDLDFTVVSVVSNDKYYFDHNVELTARLNGGEYCDWLAVYNITEDPEDWSKDPDGKYRLLEGIKQSPNTERRMLSRGKVVGHPMRSYYHSAALKKGLAAVDRRFVCILDPDLYCVRPNWIRDVVKYVEDNNITFFGVPYHPADVTKPRFFPTVMLMVVDTKNVDLSMLNFDPEPNDLLAQKSKIYRPDLPLMERIFRCGVGAASKLVGDRRRHQIASLGDTGVSLFDKFRDQPKLKYESTVPVFFPESKFSGLTLAMDKFMPNRYRYVPTTPGFHTRRCFKDFGFHDLDARKCHEYFWQEKPFAFHLRGSIKPFDDDLSAFEKVLDEFR